MDPLFKKHVLGPLQESLPTIVMPEFWEHPDCELHDKSPMYAGWMLFEQVEAELHDKPPTVMDAAF